MSGNNEPTITISRPDDMNASEPETGKILDTVNALLKQLIDEREFGGMPVSGEDPVYAETFILLRRLAGVAQGGTGIAVPHAAQLTEADSALLAPALSAIVDAVFILDSYNHVLFCNRAGETLCGNVLKQIRGKPIGEVLYLLDEKTLDRCTDPAMLLDGTSVKEMKFILSNSDAADHSVTIRCDRLSGGDGKVSGMVLMVRDCTRQELLEEELLRARKLESVGILAGGIAHDFNNILTGIITNLFMARMNVYKNTEACQLIADAEKAAFKATRLTKQLLTFSQGGAPVKECVSVAQLIEETVGFSLSGSNVDYKLCFGEDTGMVEVDKGQVDQVLNNLIINAAQAMPEGGTVTISAENSTLAGGVSVGIGSDIDCPLVPLPDGEYVRVSVRDEGPGIPRKHLGKIFDPYFSTKAGSTGLGLTTAYSVIKKHGGHIDVDSRHGKGAVFSFYLPAFVPEKKSDTPDDFHKVEATGSVLVMDDDVIVRTVVEKLLKKTGFSVVAVTNGSDALRTYTDAFNRKDPFRFVIMDLTIPGGMGGKETVLKMKEFDPDAQVVVFSGYSNDPILTNYKEYGFDGVLKKPFSTDELMQLIKVIGTAKG